jgi:SAM-dependent methyltransferase
MHAENMFWWCLQKHYHESHFKGRKVLECGSRHENGTIRVLFEDCDYTGVDFRDGENVDRVSLIHNLDYEDSSFDVVVSSSMLEHDPYWSKSLTNMARMLKPSGCLFLSWGCGGNIFHCPEHCPDYSENKFAHHPHKAQKVIEFLEKIGLHIQSFGYEYNLKIPRDWELGRDLFSGKPYRKMAAKLRGMCGLVAFKDESLLDEPQWDKFFRRDLIGQKGGV